MSPKIFIGVPVHGGAMMMSTVISLIVSIKECATNGWELPQFYFRVGDSDLARSRNVIIGRFLDTDCTDLVLVDSDISWAPGTLTRLVTHKKDFVAGAYKGKTDEKEMYFILWPEKKEMWTDPETGNPINLGHMGAKIWESNLIGYLEKIQSVAMSEELVSVRDERIDKALLEGFPKEAAE